MQTYTTNQMTTNLSYFESLASLNYSKTFFDPEKNSGWLTKEDTLQVFKDIIDNVQDDASYFVQRFQSLIIKEVTTMTLSELVDASAVQVQNQLNPKRIEDIWRNSSTGLASAGVLLNDPKVAQKADGSYLLIGGNHRVAALLLPFVATGNFDEEVLATVELEVLMHTVDRDALTLLLSAEDEAGNLIPPTSEYYAKQHDALVYKLLEADNQSRKMQSNELVAVKFHRDGIDRTNNNSILSALFERKVIKEKDAACFIGMNAFNNNESLTPVDTDDSTLCHRAVSVPCISVDSLVPIKRNTFDKIFGSFYSALKADAVQDEAGKNKKIWSKDLKDYGLFLDIFTWLDQEEDVLGTAIDNVLTSLEETDPMRNNVAYNAVAIGKELYSIFSEDNSPEYNVLETAKRTPKRKVKYGSLAL